MEDLCIINSRSDIFPYLTVRFCIFAKKFNNFSCISAEDAVLMDCNSMSGKIIRVKKIDCPLYIRLSAVVFLKNLKADVNQADVQRHFKVFGEIDNIFLDRDNSGDLKEKGHFVKFTEVEGAVKAIQKGNETFLKEKKVTVVGRFSLREKVTTDNLGFEEDQPDRQQLKIKQEIKMEIKTEQM